MEKTMARKITSAMINAATSSRPVKVVVNTQANPYRTQSFRRSGTNRLFETSTSKGERANDQR